jgi:hypothetical protein
MWKEVSINPVLLTQSWMKTDTHKLMVVYVCERDDLCDIFTCVCLHICTHTHINVHMHNLSVCLCVLLSKPTYNDTTRSTYRNYFKIKS